MLTPWTEEERRSLLQARAMFRRGYEAAMSVSAQSPPFSQPETEAIVAAEKHFAAIEGAELEYFERLPLLTVSCCPFCAHPLVRTFDRFGLDGIWWRADAVPVEPAPCPHFCVLLGAIAFGGHQPQGGEFEVNCGPEAPYVVPRLLRQPGMVAVVSSIPMAPGYTAYPIAYFAEQDAVPQNLTAGWRRNIYTYPTEDGGTEWRADNDPWDFDLLPWLKERKLYWCSPGDNSSLSGGTPESCPYLDLPGQTARLMVYGDLLFKRGLPNGSALS